MSGSRVLIVEDEVIVAMSIERTLSSFGYDVVGLSTTPEDAIRIAAELKPDIVLMDINLEGEIDGIDAAEKIVEMSDIPVVYLTSYTNEDTLRRAMGTNPYGYLTKPVRPREIYTTIETVLNKHRAEMAEKKLRVSRKTQWEILNSIDLGLCISDYDPDEERCTIVAINNKACRILGVSGKEVWKRGADLGEFLPGVGGIVSRCIAEGRKNIQFRSKSPQNEQEGTERRYVLRIIGSENKYSVLISIIDFNRNDISEDNYAPVFLLDELKYPGMDVSEEIIRHTSSILALCEGREGFAEEISEHAQEIENILKNR